ncbi:PQQ-binding-like beta-propeller repeat protein [Verticiella sediminum]|uniref:PQQ-binding-like beta-propeller repeat protein n=2 Tax=Verticiella sediminum TaxID=1247510 RepID=A0A556AZ18_9BURK|nr:PQQ-binding-like beta-propeller repeat protein [Verticiella sediminum]
MPRTDLVPVSQPVQHSVPTPSARVPAEPTDEIAPRVADGTAIDPAAAPAETVEPARRPWQTGAPHYAACVALGSTLVLFAAVAIASWFVDPHDIDGRLPPQRAASSDQDPAAPAVPPGEWHAYGRTGYGQRYSPLTQITPQNVSDLREAWRYRTGDVRGRPGDPEETTFEVTPLKIGNRLIFCTPHQSVIALDATSGDELWRYDPLIQGELALQHLTCRGLSYHDGRGSPIDRSPAATPLLVPAAAGSPADAQGDAAERSTGVAGGPNVDGSQAGDDPQDAAPTNAPPGTGAYAQGQSTPYTRPGQPVAAADAQSTRNDCGAKLFMPTADGRIIALSPEDGAVCADFGSGTGQINLWDRMPNVNPGSYYSTSPVVVSRNVLVVAGTVLDNVSTSEASGVVRGYDVHTGALLWNWDSANPEATEPLAPGQTYTPNSPNSWAPLSVDESLGLVYVPMGNQPPDQWGGNRSAEAGRYSSSVVALELASGRVRWHFQTVRHDLWDYDVPAQPSLVDLVVDGQNVPALVQPTKQGDIYVLDRRSGEPILPVADVAAPQGAVEGDTTAPTQPASALSFAAPPLTGRDMWGATMFDQLACRIQLARLRYEGRYTPPSLEGTLVYPGNFGTFNWGGVAIDPQRQIVFATPTHLAFVSQLVPREDDTTLYVQGQDTAQGSLPSLNENFGAPYAVRLQPFLSPLSLPCQAPPWGYVAGADLTSGEIAWKHRNGTVRDRSPIPLPFRMGVPSLGGPMITAAGVGFLSGTIDYYVRAYDVDTGERLWQSRLPAGAQATPMTYVGEDGRQYLLVVAGGHGSLETKPGDYVIAYALPR